MKILALGDITEPRVAVSLPQMLKKAAKEYRMDCVIANGENAGFIMGPTPETAHALLSGGIDCLTGGNHTVQNKYLYGMMENDTRLLRPANYPATVPGRGYTILSVNGYRVLVMNVLGQVHMEPNLDSPYETVERILAREAGHYDISVLDIHAEATGEKVALARAFDGRISAVFGTHTHIPTADLVVLPNGTGYVTDLGMCGGSTGILGLKTSVILERMKTRLPVKSEPDDGPVVADGVLFDIDESTSLCRRVTRVKLEESEICDNP